MGCSKCPHLLNKLFRFYYIRGITESVKIVCMINCPDWDSRGGIFLFSMTRESWSFWLPIFKWLTFFKTIYLPSHFLRSSIPHSLQQLKLQIIRLRIPKLWRIFSTLFPRRLCATSNKLLFVSNWRNRVGAGHSRYTHLQLVFREYLIRSAPPAHCRYAWSFVIYIHCKPETIS